MRLRRLIVPLGLLLLGGLLVWRSGSGSESLRYYNPEEYVARADSFIRRGYLKAECLGDLPRIEEADIRNAPEAEQSWYAESYLSDDVKRFNADPSGFGWAFVIDDDCRLRGVNASVHRIELPFADPIRWLGSLFYRGAGSQAMLRSAQRSITLRSPEKPVPAREEATTRVGARQDVAEQGAVLLHFAGGPGQPAARLFPVGRETVMSNRVRRNQREAVRLLGHQLPVGRMARFQSGDWLQLEAEAPKKVSETFVYVGATALTSASRMRLSNDRFERTTDDPGLGLIAPAGQDEPSPYLDLVTDSLDNALAALPEKRARELARGFDVQLTLERGTQLRLSEAFRQAVAAIQAQHPGLPFGAGMTVLDGKSGDVLALATYPWEDDLGRVDDEKERRRLLRNQNLLLHPIGSSGKPFFFAAIADAFPFLMETVIDPYELSLDQREILQCEMPKGYRVPTGYGAPVDFRTALQISSNRYAVELATLAIAAGGGRNGGTLEDLLPPDPEVHWPLPGQTSGIQIGGRALDYAPRLDVIHKQAGAPVRPESKAAELCVTVDQFEQVRFREPFERLTGAATYWGTNPQKLPEDLNIGQLNRAYRTGRYDLRLFKPLLAHLFAGADQDQQWKIRAAAQEMSPERVNLAFNQVSRLREDYVTLLLGGGNSIWTNVQLAEAMSRLVTGRAVEARVVSRVLPRKDGESSLPPPEPPRPLAKEIAIRPEARRAVLEGINRVGRAGGTAPVMEPAVERFLRPQFPGDRIDLFSKTGSPVLERPVPAAMGRALEKLVSRSRLAIEGRTLVVRTKTGNVPQRGPEQKGRQDYRRALARALSETGVRNASPWLISHLADVLDDFAEDLKAGDADPTEGPIAAENGAVHLNRNDRLFRQRLVTGKGAVYVFSLVRRPGGAADIPTPADFRDPKTRVVTVAIFLAVGPDSHVAVEVASKIVPELAGVLK